MHTYRSFLNRIFTLMVVLGMLLSQGALQPVTALDGEPPVVVIDGSQTLTGSTSDPLAKIEPQVLDEIQANGQTDYFVWVSSKVDLSPANQLGTQQAKGEFVFSTLEAGARASQAGVTALLAQAGAKFESYYIVNRVLVRGGSRSLALELAARPDVTRLTANHTYQIDPVEMVSTPAPAQPQAVGSNISFIKANQVWNLGYNGTGIVLAGQDTGMQWDHPALKSHYRGWNGSTADHNYNWWDATGTYPTTPGDGHGHGTHTSGTMVGDDGAGNQIGVAPGAKLIHCKSFTNTGSTSDAAVLDCFAFFLAPWDLNHANPNPAKAPNAINNSWGWGGGNHTTFVTAINNLQAAGILVEVSAGNDGPGCQTLGSPGDYDNVLTTGSVDSSFTFPGNIVSTSSRGPSKITPSSFMPDVMAPGAAIRSSLPGNTYGNMDGTSMAGPHVTALVALLWQAAPSLKGHVPETIAAIKGRAVPLAGQAGSNCGGNYTTGPNHDWGVGTVDAYATVYNAIEGTLRGTVTASAGGLPLSGVKITAGAGTTNTAADGAYSLSLASGSYTVTAQLGGYVPQTRTGVAITKGNTTTLNISMPAAAATAVSGTVKDGTPGGHTYPLYAKINFATYGRPDVITFTDPFSGAYRASLLMNVPYTATVTSTLPGYTAAPVDFTPTANPFTKNFLLLADAAGCTAPGYANSRVFFETFDSVAAPALPAAWTVAKIGSGSTANWTSAGASSHPSGISPVSSPNMAVFNSYAATAGHQAMLYTNTPTSLTSGTSAYFTFWMYHDSGYSSNNDLIQTAVSTDGSTFYMTGNNFSRYSASAGWVLHTVDISSYAGPGKPSVYIGLVGTSAYGNDIHIDSVSINGPCLKTSGGRVAGYVSSQPSGRAIISALVSSTARPAENGYSIGRGDDPALRDGFYQLFSSGSGPQNFAATAIRHQWAEKIITVADEGVTRLDLSPTSAWVNPNPNSVSVTLAVGATATTPLTLSNPGPLAANFTIQPAASALTSGSTLAGPFPYREERVSDDPTATQAEPAAGKAPEGAAPPLKGGELLGGGPRLDGVTTPFPGTAGYRYATASCDRKIFYVFGGQTGSTSVNEVWMYNPANNSWTARAPMPTAASNMRAACIDGKIYLVGGYASSAWNNAFQIYDTQADTWTSTTQPVTGGPMVVAYNGLLYAMGGAGASGAMAQANVYNPSTGMWSVLAPMPTPTRYAGAVVYNNLIFIIAGYDTSDVQVYNPASNGWNNSGPNLPGSRMDPVVGWYGDSIYLIGGGGYGGNNWQAYPEGYVLNASAWPGGAWTQFSPTFQKAKSAPASICADNRLWSVGGTVSSFEEHITQFYDAGLLCNRAYPAVPWLTATPASGSVPLAGTRTITLGFAANAAPYNVPGVYHAVLKLNSDPPGGFIDIPVTMTVVMTSSALTITPPSWRKTVYPHGYASYDFEITNKTAGSEQFNIGSASITPGWTGVISPASFTIPTYNGVAILNVKMYPPASSKDGDEGVVLVKVCVHDNPSQCASLAAIAIVQYYKIRLPTVIR